MSDFSIQGVGSSDRGTIVDKNRGNMFNVASSFQSALERVSVWYNNRNRDAQTPVPYTNSVATTTGI